MEKAHITHTGQPRLIALFLGWGMDATPFSGLSKPGYDITAFFDYADFDPDAESHTLTSEAQGYEEVVVIAWSLGVRAATDLLQRVRQHLPITRAIAINGTMTHVHPTLGIPPAIFNGTLANLSEASVRKFRRRMFADASSFAAFEITKPQRTLESLRKELSTFANMPPATGYTNVWNMAIAGGCDAIFAPQAQTMAWQQAQVPCQLADSMPHFPPMQAIINSHVVDKNLVAERFASAHESYRTNAAAQQQAATRLWQLAHPHLPAQRPLRVLEVGVGSGMLTDLYLPHMHGSEVTLWDIAPIPNENIPMECRFIQCDAETKLTHLPQGSIDLFLSASTMQWFNSPEAFIDRLYNVLAPGGVAAISLYGPGNCSEIAQAIGSTLRYPSPDALKRAATNAGFEVVQLLQEEITLTFPSITSLLRHMRLTGVNALERTTSAAQALRLMRCYPLRPDGTAPLTYRPIYIILRHKNQETV